MIVAEHTPGNALGPDDPGRHPSAEKLRGYLADRLAGAEARAVADHLEVCDRCVEALDELGSQPVQLPPPTTAGEDAWDERRMRRSVRRTVLVTAVNTVLLLILAVMVLQLLAWFVIHPLLIDRGDRLADHVTATIDVPVMTIPGAELSQLMSSPGIRGRTTEVELQRTVGRQVIPLGTFTTRLGPRRLSVPSGADIGPRGPGLQPGVVDLGPVSFEPERLADGTAATVQLTWYDDALDLAAADAVADGSDRLTLLWVGFRIPGGEHAMDPSWQLGYSARGGIPTWVQEQRRGTFGGGGDFRTWEVDSGAQHALEELRRATANLADIGWPDRRTATDGALADLTATAEQLATNEPAVTSVVITGPTQTVADAVAEHAPDEAILLELDFDR
jgi:hypothetical protein